jgi:hypothetical protein
MPFSKNNKGKGTNPRTPKHALCGPDRKQKGPRPRKPQRPTKRTAAVPLGRVSASLEDQAPRHEVPASLEGRRPHGRVSASLEGVTPPRASLCLARGRLRPATPQLLPRPTTSHQTNSCGTPRVSLRLARGPGAVPRSPRLA